MDDEFSGEEEEEEEEEFVEAFVYDITYENRFGRRGESDGTTIKLWTRCANGDSRCVRVEDFEAYFRIEAPPEEEGVDACEELELEFQAILREKKSTSNIDVHIVPEERTPLMSYQQEAKAMFRVHLSSPRGVAPLRTAIVGCDDRFGEAQSARTIFIGSHQLAAKTYDSNVEFVIRHMIDSSVRCNTWIRVPVCEWTDGANSLCSATDILIGWHDIAIVEEEQKPPPLRVLSLDIECDSPTGGFPDATNIGDAVIQIACDLTTADGRSMDEIENTAQETFFAVGKTAPLDEGGKYPEYADVDLRCYDTEEEMLLAFAEYVQLEADPDFITGYNIGSFDFAYLVVRAETLGLGKAGVAWSRVPGFEVKNNFGDRSSKARGATKDNKLDVPGRVILDLLLLIRAGWKLHKYKLNYVAEHFLNECKDDVAPKEITKLWHGTPEDRARLARYCVQDTRLPRRLMYKLMLHLSALEQARVCCVPVNWLVTRGQGIKVFAQICAFSHEHGYAVDYIPTKDKDGKYQGATVLKPTLGFFEEPVVVLDFRSLYPSIMIAYNYCYTTHVPAGPEAERMISEGKAERAPDIVDVDEDTGKETTRAGSVFVTAAERQGVLPLICEILMKQRAQAKEEMAAATDPFIRAVLDQRQLALKIACNSVYGYSGAVTGRLPCIPVAESVTAMGRQMIDITAATAEKEGPVGTRTLYGDTDSVFLTFGIKIDYDAYPDDPREAERQAAILAFAAATVLQPILNAQFRKPNFLEVEKVYGPFLQVGKKRYAGMMFAVNRSGDVVFVEISKSGLEMVRRDNCALVRETLDQAVDIVITQRSPDAAIKLVQDTIQALVEGKVGYDKLTITRAFSRPLKQYASMPEHGFVMTRMAERAETNPNDDIAAAHQPYLGDRVEYAIMAPSDMHPEQPRVSFDKKTGKKKTLQPRVAERAEDPTWAAAHDCVPDALYYIENQLLKPCRKIVAALVGTQEEATRKMLQPIFMKSVPERGIVRKRLGEGTVRALYGSSEISGRRRNAKDELKREGARAQKRKFGTLDAFFKPAASTAAAAADDECAESERPLKMSKPDEGV